MQTGVENGFRLSPQQSRLWELLQSDNGSAYRVLSKTIISGDIDRWRLEESLRSVIQRHETFRTTFQPRWDEAGAAQIISETHPLSLIDLDLSGMSLDDQEFSIGVLLRDANRLTIDFANGPLMHALIVILSPSSHVLILSSSSLCADKTTIKNLLKEVTQTYSSLSSGGDIFDDAIRYTDLAEWQNELLESEDTEYGTRFWKEIDLSPLSSYTLPFPGKLDKSDRFEPACFSFTIAESLAASIRAIADQQGASQFAYLFACWQTLLSRLADLDSIISGVVFEGRRSEEVEAATGLFAKHLPVRTDFEGCASFIETLRQVQHSINEADKRQEFFSYDQIKGSAGEAAHPAFFPFCFEFEKQVPECRTQDATFSLSIQGDHFDRFTVKLSCIESDGSLRAELHYDSTVLQWDAVERMAGEFQSLLISSAANPESPARRLNILTDVERELILAHSNKSNRTYSTGRCIHELFERRAEHSPGNVAVVFGGERLSYSELNRRANQLASHLRKLNVGPDVRVGVYLEPSLEMIVGLLGILKAGGAYVPVDMGYPAQRIAFMLRDAEVAVLLTSSGLATSLRENSAKVVCLDSDWDIISHESEQNVSSSVCPENLAYMIYTSGSTGAPKGTQVTHANVVRLLEATADWFHVDENDIWTLFHSYAFDFSVWEIWGALSHGSRLVVVPYKVTRAPEEFRELLYRENVTILNQTPSAFRQLVRADEDADRARELNLRLVIFGGEAIDLPSLRPWFGRYGDRKPQLVNMYGITETTVHVTYHPMTVGDLDNMQGNPIGVSIPDLQTYVLDEYLNITPIGVAGELYVGGAGLARGYFKRADLTASRFIPNHLGSVAGSRLYRSGDLARFMEDGSLEYLGRIDQQVKVRGFRIELREIEAAMCEHPPIKEAVVLPFESDAGDKRLIAYFVTADDSLGVSEIRSHLKDKLPEYMIPSRYMRLKALPLTVNGKLDKEALPSPGEWRPDYEQSYVAPRTPLEDGLAEIWARFLGIERVGIHDHFFDLGGHSLLATQIVYGVRDAYEIEIPLAWFFTETPTVAGLADAIEQYQIKQAGDADIAAALEEMANLSDDEVRALLVSD